MFIINDFFTTMTYLTRDVSNAHGRQGWASDGPPAELNIMAQSTSIQRVQRLIDSVPLTNLLFTLLSTSYKKVWTPSSLLAPVCPMSNTSQTFAKYSACGCLF